MSKELDYIADLERENRTLRSLLYCTKRSCNNCGKVNCENFQRQRIDCCGLWVSYKDYIKQQEEQIESQKEKITQAHIDGYNRGYAKAKEKIDDIKANCDLAIEGRDVKIKELENQVKDLEKQLTEKVTLESLDVVSARIAELEKENAELKSIERMALYSKLSDQLTKAKELLQRFIKWARTENCEKFDVILTDAEQFIKEIEK